MYGRVENVKKAEYFSVQSHTEACPSMDGVMNEQTIQNQIHHELATHANAWNAEVQHDWTLVKVMT